VDFFRLFGLVIVAVVNLGLARAVYLNNRRSATHRSFAIAVTSIVCWLVLAFLSDQPVLASWALPLNQLTMAAATAGLALLLHFVLLFPKPVGRIASPWRIAFTVSAAVTAITAFTPLVVAAVLFKSYGTDLVPGPMFVTAGVWQLLTVICIVVALALKFRRITGGRERAQLRFLLLGLALFTISAITLGLLLPMAVGSYQLSSLNTFTSLFIVGFVAYAMIKHRLMEMRLVVLRAVAYSLLTVILGIIVVAPTLLVNAVGLGLSVGQMQALTFVSALAAVFIFQPLQRLLAKVTDRLFYRQAYEEYELLLRLAGQIATMVDLAEIVETVTDGLVQDMKLTSARIAINGIGRDDAAEGMMDLEESELRLLIDACGGRRILLADELDDDEDALRLLNERGVFVVVPLLGEGLVAGALLLGEKRSGEIYTERDVRLLEVLAPAVAVALRIAQMFEERKWNASIVDCSNDAIIGEAADGTIISWNKAAEEIYGYAADEIVGSTMARLIPPGQLSDRQDLEKRLFEGERVEHVETRHVRKDGREIDVSLTLSPIEDSSSQAIGISAIVRDISERRHLEQAKDDFIAMVSHELRTPLTAIIGYASLLEDEGFEAGSRAMLCSTRIRERGAHMQSLVEQLLQVLQTTRPQTELARQDVDLGALVRACLDALPPGDQSRLRVIVPKRIRPVSCEADRLAVAISNLVSNALKFSAEGTEVGIAVRQTRDWTSVVVSDHGTGIPASSIPTIFDRFTQADMSSTRSFGGFGLGLFIVKQIMDEHGGNVSVKSKVGTGSTFTLRLPTHERSGRGRSQTGGSHDFARSASA
jgi:PAS domain S-box-containing protein